MEPNTNANMGYFNRSSPTNSMGTWNYVFIRYCDGWSFASDRALPSVVPVTNASGSFNVTAHFRGRAVLEAVRADLIANRGMGAASEVVVGGCSAGGLAVFLHCDEWAAALHAAKADMKVVCLSDSGWFPLVPATGFPSAWFNGVWEGGFNWHNISATLSPACLADRNASTAWQCTMAEVAALYVETPLFLYQAQYDSFQIFNMERCIPMPPDPTSPCKDIDVSNWGAMVTGNVRAWLDSPRGKAAGSMAFVDSCYHHCGGWADFDQIVSWQDGAGRPLNRTGSEAFALWKTNPTGDILTQDTPYPCLGAACCGPHGPDSL